MTLNRRGAAMLLILIASLSSARNAGAEETAPTVEASTAPVPRYWYGYETLLVDGAGVALTAVGIPVTIRGASSDSSSVLGIGLVGLGGVTYLLGGPIVHWAHGRVGVGFLSLALRLVAPLAGLGLGAIGSEFANGSSNQIGIPIGAAVGALAAIALDSALLGWETPAPQRRDRAHFVPAFAVNKQGVSLGLSAQF